MAKYTRVDKVIVLRNFIMRAGWLRDLDRADKEAVRLFLSLEDGMRYDVDDEYLTPTQRTKIQELEDAL